MGIIARELATEQIWSGYKHRSPVETNFYVAQDSAGMQMPRAWTENSIKRRIRRKAKEATISAKWLKTTAIISFWSLILFKAIAIAVKQVKQQQRYTKLSERLKRKN